MRVSSLDALPDNQQDSATAEALRAIVDLDLSELQAVEPPRVLAVIEQRDGPCSMGHDDAWQSGVVDAPHRLNRASMPG
jgi:hypothetical protein